MATHKRDRDDNSASDQELIERCLRGDALAWELIVERYRRRVFHITYKFTGRYEEAEDLAQEIFLRLCRCLDKFRREADFGAWLSSVARNHCIDHYRSKRREREVLIDGADSLDLTAASSGDPERELVVDDRRALLQRALARLPVKLREAVILRDLREFSYQEIAAQMKLPEGTVKSRINRGREELAQILRRSLQGAQIPSSRARIRR
ncbi:MAG: RNA polymerase sigma factor [Vicinamibacteria bacterium]|nr:RNA polymerase sigma factor [Vicinamibacteria bacterium]